MGKKQIVIGSVFVVVIGLGLFGMTKLRSRWPVASWGVICETPPKFEDFYELGLKLDIVEESCGENCQMHRIGEFYGLKTSHGLDSRLGSRLLVTNPTGKNRSVYYEFKEGNLNYLCETEKK